MTFILACSFILSGLFAGLTAGLFGIGGGSLLIPVFLYLLPQLGASQTQTMHQAIATSLAIIIPSTLTASIEQYKLKHLEKNILITWLPFVLLGLITATLIFHRISATVLQMIFIIYLLLCAIYMLFKPARTEYSQPPMTPHLSYYIAGFFVGILSILLGIGGGTMTTPYFTWHHYPIKKAIAISSATGVFIGTIGTASMIITGWHASDLAPYSVGYVNYAAFFMTTPFCILSALFGAKINNRIPDQILNLLYVIFLIFIAVYMMFQ